MPQDRFEQELVVFLRLEHHLKDIGSCVLKLLGSLRHGLPRLLLAPIR